jgi:hypothetical protein
MLLSKETLRVRSTKGKKKSGLQELFGGEVANFGNAENQLQNWQQLGMEIPLAHAFHSVT